MGMSMAWGKCRSAARPVRFAALYDNFLWGDLAILARSIPVVLSGKGAY
jgi:hypothetical protein